MKKFSVLVAGQEAVVVNADTMIISDDNNRLILKLTDGSLVATFSYGHVLDAHEVQV